MPHYDVLYIDKFVDPNCSRAVIRSTPILSCLSAKTQLRLVSGRPALVKRCVNQAMAENIRSEIISVGGTSWIQRQSLTGKYTDRRCNKRRYLVTRRTGRRSEAFQSDRRKGYARRKNVLLY